MQVLTCKLGHRKWYCLLQEPNQPALCSRACKLAFSDPINRPSASGDYCHGTFVHATFVTLPLDIGASGLKVFFVPKFGLKLLGPIFFTLNLFCCSFLYTKMFLFKFLFKLKLSWDPKLIWTSEPVLTRSVLARPV